MRKADNSPHRHVGPAQDADRPGDVEWDALFGALWRTGYDGDVIIEHEDRDFEGTDELVKRGFLLARDVLRPYIK